MERPTLKARLVEAYVRQQFVIMKQETTDAEVERVVKKLLKVCGGSEEGPWA